MPHVIEPFMRYFLLPRRESPDAPWILCFACDHGGYPDAQVDLGGRGRALDPEAAGTTLQAIAGLAALNGAYAVLGLVILWTVRGLPRWSDAVRSAGLGYLLGIAAFGALWTELLVLGVPFRRLGDRAVARRRHLRRARRGPAAAAPASRPPRSESRSSAPAALLVTAAGVALTGLMLESLFRAARLQSLQAYDAWAFWVPKAKAIYFFGGLDEQVFTTAAGPTYPPVVPILDAAAFHAMGGADTVTLHLQFWFFVTGAVAAVACVLHRHVPAWLLWPSVVLVLALPRFAERLLRPQADVLVDLFWSSRPSFSSSGYATRTPGGSSRRRSCWRARRSRSGRGSCSRPLRWASRWRCTGEGGPCGSRSWPPPLPYSLWPSPGASGTAARVSAGRPPPMRVSVGRSIGRSTRCVCRRTCSSTRRSGRSFLFVALVALAAALVWGDRRLAAFLGSLLAVVFVGGAWVTYSYVDVPITAEESVNPIVRYTGAIVLLAAVSTPLLLASAWSDPPERES